MNNSINKYPKNNLNMLEGSLFDKIVLFALPLAISSVLQQLFNAADLAVVGRFASPVAMAAVGSNSAVINLIVSLFVGLSVGANAVIAMQIGKNRKDQISETVHTVITISLIVGVLLIFIGVILAKPILILMGAPLEVMNLAVIYLRIYFFAMPAIMIYNYGSAILRSKGDSRRPLYAMTLSGVINIFLNLIFVVAFHLHVIGVALATVISNIFGAGLVLYFLMTEEETFRLSFKKLTIKKEHLLKMMSIGIPAGIQGAVFSLSNVVIQSSVNSFGSDAIAGSTAAANFDFVSYCIINAFAQSAVTFTSQNYGAGKFDRCKKVFRICFMGGLFSSAIVVFLFVTFRYQIIQLFTTDPRVIEFAMKRIMTAFVLHFLIATYEVSGGALRGMNHSLLPAMISIFGTCVFRLLYVFVYVSRVHTFEALFRVYPYSWVITGIVTMSAYYLIRNKMFKVQQ
ncbi:MATE family efflux transporter [Butyrivibrio sp. JL13D10]|uniref:MATE family efflux transporter n=1 Tax=Butyrivibrio sp. JL13D10 TaxID=3236815 RepID=UPI0038B592BC